MIQQRIGIGMGGDGGLVDFGLVIHSTADGTRPVAAMGTSVTPTQNDFGTAAYAQLIAGASLTDDAYVIEICANTIGIAGGARNGLVRIGLDAAGGTSYTALVDLVCGPACSYMVGSGLLAGGVRFRFPFRIRAGTSIGAAATVNSATLTAINVFCQVKCRPSGPVWAGTFIDAYGVDTATSAGTAVTPGTVSEGAFASMGTLARPARFFEFGWGINNATMQNGMIHVDLGIGASNKIAIANHPVANSANECIAKPAAGAYAYGAAGSAVSLRAQAGGTLETGHTGAIYAVG